MFGSVEFQPSRARRSQARRVWVNVVYFAVFALWAVVGCWHTHPVLGVASAFVFVEVALATVRVSGLAGGVVFNEAMAARVAPAVVELCARAGCSQPRVVIRDSLVRAAGVRPGRRGRVLLVLSSGFVERVDDRQLRAILAHEVIHIARRDLRWAKTRAWFVAVVGAAGGLGLAVVAGAGGVFPVYVAGIMVVTMAVQVAVAFFNRPLERRADVEGAWLCGDPTGLAEALSVAHVFSEEARERIHGRPPWRWLLSPLSWRVPTHPPMHDRLARLDQMAGVNPA